MSEGSLGKVPTNTEQPGTQPQAADGSRNALLPEPAVLASILAKQGLTPAKAEVVVQQITMEMKQRLHQGPLPAVEDFQGYEEVCPGAAQEILDMAVRQQKHVHSVETMAVLFDFALPVIGIVAAVAVIGGMIYSGIYLAMHGHENLAVAAFTGTGAATIAGAFLQSKKKKPDQNGKPPQQQNKKKKPK